MTQVGEARHGTGTKGTTACAIRQKAREKTDKRKEGG
jgi:hypothetical protein